MLRRLLALAACRAAAAQCHDDSIASMLCSPAKPPRVAVCISGAARTFEHALVHRSLKENLIDRLGAPTTVFAYLKLADARGDNRTKFNGLIHATEAVRRAAERVGVAALELEEEWHTPPPNCPNYKARFLSTTQCPGCHINSEAHHQSLLGQLVNHKKCFEMLKKHEHDTHVVFDWVIYVRPDLTWWQPVAPWCRHILPKRQRDWSFWIPRDRAKKELYEPWAAHYACKSPPNSGEMVEKFFRKNSKLMSIRPVETIPAVLTRVPGGSYPGLCHKPLGRGTGDTAPNCHASTTGNVCNRRATAF